MAHWVAGKQQGGEGRGGAGKKGGGGGGEATGLPAIFLGCQCLIVSAAFLSLFQFAEAACVSTGPDVSARLLGL